MRIDQYRAQTGVIQSDLAEASIAKAAKMEPSEFRSALRNGKCTRRQRKAIAAAIGIDPHDLTFWED